MMWNLLMTTSTTCPNGFSLLPRRQNGVDDCILGRVLRRDDVPRVLPHLFHKLILAHLDPVEGLLNVMEMVGFQVLNRGRHCGKGLLNLSLFLGCPENGMYDENDK